MDEYNTRYNTRAAEILEKAADLLETVGHVKGKSISHSDDYQRITGYCATGAIMEQEIDYHDALGWRARTGTYRILASLIPGDGYGEDMAAKIIAWNDEPERTAAEVIDLMKHAAKDLRNKQ